MHIYIYLYIYIYNIYYNIYFIVHPVRWDANPNWPRFLGWIDTTNQKPLFLHHFPQVVLKQELQNHMKWWARWCFLGRWGLWFICTVYQPRWNAQDRLGPWGSRRTRRPAQITRWWVSLITLRGIGSLWNCRVGSSWQHHVLHKGEPGKTESYSGKFISSMFSVNHHTTRIFVTTTHGRAVFLELSNANACPVLSKPASCGPVPSHLVEWNMSNTKSKNTSDFHLFPLYLDGQIVVKPFPRFSQQAMPTKLVLAFGVLRFAQRVFFSRMHRCCASGSSKK